MLTFQYIITKRNCLYQNSRVSSSHIQCSMSICTPARLIKPMRWNCSKSQQFDDLMVIYKNVWEGLTGSGSMAQLNIILQWNSRLLAHVWEAQLCASGFVDTGFAFCFILPFFLINPWFSVLSFWVNSKQKHEPQWGKLWVENNKIEVWDGNWNFAEVLQKHCSIKRLIVFNFNHLWNNDSKTTI